MAKRTEAPPSDPAVESPTKKAKRAALPLSAGDSDDSATENDTLSSTEDPPYVVSCSPSRKPDAKIAQPNSLVPRLPLIWLATRVQRPTQRPQPPLTPATTSQLLYRQFKTCATNTTTVATFPLRLSSKYREGERYNSILTRYRHHRSRMDTGGRKVKNDLGYYRPPELLKAGVDLNWKGRFLQVGQNQLVVSVMVRNMASVFRLKSREDIDSTDEDPVPASGTDIPSRQFLRFHPLRDIDREGLDYVLYGQQSPKTRAYRSLYYVEII